jgi:hypothetical protein
MTDEPMTITVERTSGPQLWFACEGHAYRLDHPGTFAHMPQRYRLLAQALMRFAETWPEEGGSDD